MAAIVRTKLPANDWRFRKDGFPVPSIDPSGFDAATGKILFRGTIQQLYDTFPIGGSTGDAALPDAPSGSIMYCLGPQGQPVRGFGHIWADIGWKGIVTPRNLGTNPVNNLSATDHVQSVALNMTTDETLWPQTRDGNLIYLGKPYCPNPRPGETEGLRTLAVLGPGGSEIPTQIVPWRVRLIGRVYTASIRGISIGDRSAIIRAPRCTIPDPHLTDDIPAGALSWDDLPDPLVTWSDDTGSKDGWLCRSYQRPGGEYPMGNKILAFWSAEYEWIRRYSP